MNSLHSCQKLEVQRKWHSNHLHSTDFVYPVFLVNDDNAKEEIKTFPGQFRYGINRLVEDLKGLIKNGLGSVLLFGSSEAKDEMGSSADCNSNVVVRAIPILKEQFPKLVVICDVCLCPYTSHGHCGVIADENGIDVELSCKRIAEIALTYAKAGADIVAPSDMMEGRIKHISEALSKHNLRQKVAIMSYSAKFASSFYGPFRDAANSSPSFGDRKKYQLPPPSDSLALKAIKQDVLDGADYMMIKPGLPYLDILKQAKETNREQTFAVYHVSGEYAMLWHAAQAGSINLKESVFEVCTSFKRAGADIIITYFTPLILEWLRSDNKP